VVLSHEFVIQDGNSAYKSDNSNDSFVGSVAVREANFIAKK
tara:strand:+ start:16 stop:138 length:123 start_codon:yes stop_codon:yes gene_type:complete